MALTQADAAAAFAGVIAAGTWNEVTRPFIGAPLTTLIAAGAGALAAFAYYSEPNRWRLFGMAAANTFFGATLLVMLPLWFGWPPVEPHAEPPAAFLLAAACRWIIPIFIDVAPAWIRKKLGAPPPPEKSNEG